MKMRILFYIATSYLLLSIPVLAIDLPKPLVDTQWLEQNLQQVVVLDVRTSAKSFSTQPVYRKDQRSGRSILTRVGGHIPGARLALYKDIRADQQIDGRTIQYMLPNASTFERVIQKAGINQHDPIVIATNAENDFDVTIASRVYWQLRYFGHDQVTLLDGGTAQWLLDGHPVETDTNAVTKGNWRAQSTDDDLLAGSIEVEAAIADDNVQLVDVRPLSQYLGKTKSSKVSASGHIPTARVQPLELVVNSGLPSRFSSREELQQIADALGVDTNKSTITYCNSGHMASGGWFALHEILGNKNVQLYDGSMHQWTAENRPTVRMKME